MTTIEALDKIAQDDGFDDWEGFYEFVGRENTLKSFIQRAIILFYEENIKLDRINVAENAIAGKQGAFGVYWNRGDLLVDKYSIINCKNLELK